MAGHARENWKSKGSRYPSSACKHPRKRAGQGSTLCHVLHVCRASVLLPLWPTLLVGVYARENETQTVCVCVCVYVCVCA